MARFSTTDTVTGVVAFLTGIISVYSSTSGVVLPAFLPMVPGLAEQLGGANPLGIATAMNIGGHLVDVSPLSTIGALCIAGAPGRGEPQPVQQAAGVGPVDVGRRRAALLGVVLIAALRSRRVGGRRFNTEHEARRHGEEVHRVRPAPA